MSEVTLLLMVGGGERSDVEEMVTRCRQAVALDTIGKALSIGAIGQIVVSTNSLSFAETLRSLPIMVELDPPGEGFHFGRTVRRLVEKYGMRKVFYVGGGSCPLLSASSMEKIAEKLIASEEVVIANNYHSTDFAAISPAGAINAIAPLPHDNAIAWQLVKEAGLECIELPRNAATQLDVDTPADLLILKLHPSVGPNTRMYLDSLDLDTSNVERALRVLAEQEKQILLAGRVSSSVLACLEAKTSCWLRVFAEERGMRASGRQERGEVRSLLGFYIEEVGLEGFFATLRELCDTAFIDTRVLLCHKGIWPPVSERFYSDLLLPERIKNPFLRRFTEEAIEAPIPIVLGGHSLVSGGLFALAEMIDPRLMDWAADL
jgi:CTP:molybdopterin cytidylyltransferase MocA